MMDNNRIVLASTYGSRLFGTDGPASDYDFKIVFLDDLNTLVRNHQDVIQTKDEIDGVKAETEWNYIQKFANLLCAQQTFAVELLFAPMAKMSRVSDTWMELLENRHRCLSVRVAPFLGFAASQAAKYGLKGERLDTLLLFDQMVQEYRAKVEEKSPGLHALSNPVSQDFFDTLIEKLTGRPGYAYWEDTKPLHGGGEMVVRYITVGGKSYGETVPLKLWLDPLNRSVASYGKRAYDAKDAKGMDTKAIAHAVRVANQAIELLRTGTITFPRPEAEHLKDIRFGRVSHSDASDELVEKIAMAHALVDTSSLPPQPDKDFITEWANEAQLRAIRKECSARVILALHEEM